MTRIELWRRAMAAVAAAALGMAATALPAGATEPTAVGWWWAGRPSAMFPAMFSPVPAPPDGGLYVAGGPTGPSGISALRYELALDASASTLTLTIAEASGTVAVDACAAKDAWEPAENGGWDQRPEPDCEAVSVTGTVDEDQTAVTFALSSLQGDDVIDVVLVPGDDPETQRPASFSVTFEPPSAEALAVTDAADTDTSAPTSATPSAPRPVEAPSATAPASPSVAAPAAPPAPGALDTPADAEADAEAVAPNFSAPDQPTALATSVSDLEGFAYPAVLALPLVLLCAASYLGWALTRPITISRSGMRS